MAITINQVQKKDPLNGNLGSIGGMVGNYFGPVGGAIGGAVGGLAGGEDSESAVGGAALNLLSNAGKGAANAPQESNAVTRWQDNQKNVSSLQEGMKVLESNPELKKRYAPVLNEAINRAYAGGNIS